MESEPVRKLLDNYLGRVNGMVYPNKSLVVRAPVASALGRLYQPEELNKLVSDPDSLPVLPERMQDFAFRYATEFKRVSEWAKVYAVHLHTIHHWLKYPGVQKWIAVLRYERRMYLQARMMHMEGLAFAALEKFLTVRITGDNADAVGKMVRYAMELLRDPSGQKRRSMTVYLGQEPDGKVKTVGAQAEEVSEEELEALENERAYLRQFRERLARRREQGREEEAPPEGAT